jgi:hypothetical protein
MSISAVEPRLTSRTHPKGSRVNMLEAVVAAMLTSTRSSFVWVTEYGAGKRAALRLVAALALIGAVVAILDNASPAGLPIAGETRAALSIR